MTNLKLGKLQRLTPRSVWKNEARDFTPWLSENLEALSEVIGLQLEMTSTETRVGDFSADLLAKDLGTGDPVVIENQFGPTDHDHLGKVLTYASGIDAAAVVWIAESFREEHRQALEWLNQRTGEDTLFFGVMIELLQIDESLPAANLKPVVFPNEWQKMKRSRGETQSPRAEAQREYFQRLIDELREKHRFTNAKVGQPQSWYIFSSGVSGIGYGTSFAMNNRIRVELYVDPGSGEENEALFDWLLERKDLIEGQIGAELEWERLEHRRASKIAIYRPGSIDMPKPELEEVRRWAITYLLKFRATFGPLLQEYYNT